METQSRRTKMQEILAKLKDRGEDAVQGTFDYLMEKGYPDAAVAAGTLGGTAVDLMPEDEADVLMAALPIPGGKSLRAAGRAAEKMAPRVLDYGAEKAALSAAREAGMKGARSLDYKAIREAEKKAAAEAAEKADVWTYGGKEGPHARRARSN